MSKTAMAKASAHEQTRSSVALAQSEAESQHQLRQTLEHLALGMATVTTDLQDAMTSNREILSESTERTQAAMASGITSLQAGIAEIQKVAKQLSKTSEASAEQTSHQANRFRVTALATMFGIGLIAGVTLTLLYLILQPQVIQTLWTLSQRLWI